MVEIPPRLASRPKDKRGYPIPWNVLVNDGVPFFAVNDDSKHLTAIREQLCPICGDRLGKWRWFTGGPQSAFDPNGAYFDLPGHHECERFALMVCPWLSTPRYSSLIQMDRLPNKHLLPEGLVTMDPTVEPDRPLLFVSVASDNVQIIVNPRHPLPIVKPRRPYLGVEYWQNSKQLSDEEALPLLRQVLGERWNPPALRE